MLRAFKHAQNRMLSEGELRNVLFEIKRVRDPMASLSKHSSITATELTKWSTTQTSQIHEFIAAMCSADTDMTDALEEFIAAYETYYVHWKSILSERKEYKALEVDYHRAEKHVESIRKKFESAAKKDGGDLDKRIKDGQLAVPEEEDDGGRRGSMSRRRSHGPSMGELTEAMRQRSAILEKLQNKQVEVEREMHQELREGYFRLIEAKLKFFKTLSTIASQQLELCGSLKSVKGRSEKEGAVFEYEDFCNSLPEINTVWCDGDNLANTLKVERTAAREALEFEKTDHQKAVQALNHKHQEALQELRTRLEQVQREHEQLLASLKSSAEEKEMSLQDQVKSLNVQLAQTKTSRDSFKSGLESLLEQLGATVTSTAHVIKEDPIVTAADNCQHTLDRLQELGQKEHDGAASLMRKVTVLAGLLGTTIARAHAITGVVPPERGHELLERLPPLEPAAAAFFTQLQQVLSQGADHDSQLMVPMDAVINLQAPLRRLHATLAACSAGGGALPTDTENQVTRAQQLVHDAKDVIARLQREQTASEGQDERVLKLNKGIFGSDAYEGDKASAALETRHWLGAVNMCVNNVVENTPVWTECLRSFVQEGHRAEELQVSSKDLSACTAQLMAFIKTLLARSDFSSDNDVQKLIEHISSSSTNLITTSNKVTVITKDCANLRLADLVLTSENLSNMNAVQARRILMRTQVEVLRLDKALTSEREKLGHLRRELGHLLKDEDTQS